MDDKFESLSIHVLREPKIKLRYVDRESVAFLEMCDSIREHGILNSILVRPQGDVYEIVDGLCRYTASTIVGRATIPAIIREISDNEALSLQVQANAITLETKPAEYAQQIKRIMERDPDMTRAASRGVAG